MKRVVAVLGVCILCSCKSSSPDSRNIYSIYYSQEQEGCVFSVAGFGEFDSFYSALCSLADIPKHSKIVIGPMYPASFKEPGGPLGKRDGDELLPLEEEEMIVLLEFSMRHGFYVMFDPHLESESSHGGKGAVTGKPAN